MLLRKEGEYYKRVSESEESELRKKHQSGEKLFSMVNGVEVALSDEEEKEIRDFWASQEALASKSRA